MVIIIITYSIGIMAPIYTSLNHPRREHSKQFLDMECDPCKSQRASKAWWGSVTPRTCNGFFQRKKVIRTQMRVYLTGRFLKYALREPDSVCDQNDSHIGRADVRIAEELRSNVQGGTRYRDASNREISFFFSEPPPEPRPERNKAPWIMNRLTTVPRID